VSGVHQLWHVCSVVRCGMCWPWEWEGQTVPCVCLWNSCTTGWFQNDNHSSRLSCFRSSHPCHIPKMCSRNIIMSILWAPQKHAVTLFTFVLVAFIQQFHLQGIKTHTQCIVNGLVVSFKLLCVHVCQKQKHVRKELETIQLKANAQTCTTSKLVGVQTNNLPLGCSSLSTALLFAWQDLQDTPNNSATSLFFSISLLDN